jgi:hypothetical protein
MTNDVIPWETLIKVEVQKTQALVLVQKECSMYTHKYLHIPSINDSMFLLLQRPYADRHPVDTERRDGYNYVSGQLILSTAAMDPEQWPHIILRGSLAGLEPLRHAEIRDEFFVGPRELLLDSHGNKCNGIRCRVHGLSESDPASSSSSIGDVYITVSQVVFLSTGTTTTADNTAVATNTDGTSPTTEDSEPLHPQSSALEDNDWAIGATCIHLHALADEPEPSVYLQLAEEGQEDSTLEVTLIPLDQDACQTLFDGLCKLVAKHPLQLDDQDDNPGPGWGDSVEDGYVDDDDGNDDMIWAPSAGWGAGVPDLDEDEDDEEEDGGATEEERAAMLARLDKLLVVHPSLQGPDGQFDDADESSTNDNNTGTME